MITGFKNIRVNKMKIIGILILLFLATDAYSQTVAVRPIGTSVKNGAHYLNMRVWNCTNNDIEVPLSELPWGMRTLGLVIYPGGKLAGEPLKESFPVGDSPSTEIKIHAKGYVDGEIPLDQRFFDITRYEKDGNLLVFWEYDLSWITGGKSEIVGGMIPLNGKKASDAEHGVACK